MTNENVAFIEQSQPENQYLTFRLHNETFGIEIAAVREIVEYGKVTRVPLMPHFIKGVINLRGQVVPIIDIAQRFALKPLEIKKTTCVVITEIADFSVGLAVDEVDEVKNLLYSSIEAAPRFATIINPDFIKGVGKAEGRFILLLDLTKALAVESLLQAGQDGNKKTRSKVCHLRM